jgi:hypothetical protein
MALEVKVRKYKPEDKSFILATMLQGIYHGVANMALIPRSEFFDKYAKEAEFMLDSAFADVKIAYVEGDEDLIIGYLVGSISFPTVVWCFTKTAFRRQGVLNALLASGHYKNCTQLTKIGNLIRMKKGLEFIPWRV